MKSRRKSRLALEWLEDRLVPSTFTQVADIDGFAADFGTDGTYEYLDTTSSTLQTSVVANFSDNYESRTILEFNISSLNATDVVTSARFSGNIYALMGANGEPGVDVIVRGQWGDGVVETIDAIRPSLPIGALINQTQQGLFTVELDPQWVQGQLGQATYLGISLRLQRGVHFYLYSGEGSLGGGGAPTLTIEYQNGSGNTRPIANNDSYSVNEDSTLVVGAPGVLGNDTDAESNPLQAVQASSPAHGSVALASNGSFVYTPNANYYGADSFNYWAHDGQEFSYLATVYLNVNPVNDAPVAQNDNYSVNEGSTLSVAAPGLLGNDNDVDNASLTAVLSSGPAHGSLTVNPNGSLSYTPVAGYYGPDNFTYRASDGTLNSAAVTVSITVNPVNDAPVANGDSYSVNEDGALTVSAAGVLGNDTDPDSDPLTAILVTGPAHGALTLNANGSFTYAPNANFNGSDSFTYKANDGPLNSNTATVTLAVIAMNDAPVAVNNSYTVTEDQTLTIASTPGVTSLSMVSQPGDYVGQGQTYSYTPQTGTFMINRNFDNGVSVYYSGGGHWWHLDFAAPFNATLTPGYYANATRWPFQASNVPGLNVSGDGRGSNTLTGNFTVTQAVYAADGSVLRFAATFEQHSEGMAPALTGEIKYNQGTGPSGILLNDSDTDGDALTPIVVTGPAHGTLSLNSDGSFTYRPATNFFGTDNFTYKANDGVSDSNVATVNITVNPVNDFPTAVGDVYNVDEDTTLTVAAPGVLANDSDIDSSTLTAVLVTNPTRGNLTLNANGSFVYTPQANYNGTDTFSYAANDGQAFSFIVNVTLVVRAVNDAPVANNDSYTTSEDTPLTVATPGVRSNDTDVEGSALTAILVGGPTQGALTLNADGSFTYTPNSNYAGTDSFTYKVNDGSADSNVATVSLTVTNVNDAPVATGNAFTLAEDGTVTVAAPGVLGNDADVDGNVLTAALASGPAHGSLALNANGSFTYTPDANYNGADSFSYRANDGSADSNVAVVALTITSVNDAPVANAGSDASTGEGATFTFQGTASFDIDGDALSYSWNFGDGNIASGAAVSHAYADQGTYAVTLTVSDGLVSSTDTLVMTVTNGAPLALVSGPASGVRGQARTITLAADDPGPVDQAASFTYSINWGDGNSQTVSGPDSVAVDHVFTATGSYSVTVTATDKDGGVSSVAQRTITINAVEMQQGNLVVGGTTANDNIVLKVADTQGGIKVTIGGTTLGTFVPSGYVLVFAQSGGDSVQFATTKFNGQTRYIQAPAVVLGGDGNDTLDARGSNSANVLIGGAGTDNLYGGLGRDILLGGAGVDTLRGGQGEDVLIGNSTTHDANPTSLLALMAEWSRTDADYATRANHLQGAPGGLNVGAFLNATTILEDAAIDQLYGESALDLFFATDAGTNKDKVNDLAQGELNIGL